MRRFDYVNLVSRERGVAPPPSNDLPLPPRVAPPPLPPTPPPTPPPAPSPPSPETPLSWEDIKMGYGNTAVEAGHNAFVARLSAPVSLPESEN